MAQLANLPPTKISICMGPVLVLAAPLLIQLPACVLRKLQGMAQSLRLLYPPM